MNVYLPLESSSTRGPSYPAQGRSRVLQSFPSTDLVWKMTLWDVWEFCICGEEAMAPSPSVCGVQHGAPPGLPHGESWWNGSNVRAWGMRWEMENLCLTAALEQRKVCVCVVQTVFNCWKRSVIDHWSDYGIRSTQAGAVLSSLDLFSFCMLIFAKKKLEDRCITDLI